jgi:hypothetical protein
MVELDFSLKWSEVCQTSAQIRIQVGVLAGLATFILRLVHKA